MYPYALLLLFAVAVALCACGEERDGAGQTALSGTTLHVRATGMVKSLGIT